jgi:hypothetical protein
MRRARYHWHDVAELDPAATADLERLARVDVEPEVGYRLVRKDDAGLGVIASVGTMGMVAHGTSRYLCFSVSSSI